MAKNTSIMPKLPPLHPPFVSGFVNGPRPMTTGAPPPAVLSNLGKNPALTQQFDLPTY